jgi:hypothetical protein
LNTFLLLFFSSYRCTQAKHRQWKSRKEEKKGKRDMPLIGLGMGKKKKKKRKKKDREDAFRFRPSN